MQFQKMLSKLLNVSNCRGHSIHFFAFAKKKEAFLRSLAECLHRQTIQAEILENGERLQRDVFRFFNLKSYALCILIN